MLLLLDVEWYVFYLVLRLISCVRKMVDTPLVLGKEKKGTHWWLDSNSSNDDDVTARCGSAVSSVGLTVLLGTCVYRADVTVCYVGNRDPVGLQMVCNWSICIGLSVLVLIWSRLLVGTSFEYQVGWLVLVFRLMIRLLVLLFLDSLGLWTTSLSTDYSIRFVSFVFVSHVSLFVR